MNQNSVIKKEGMIGRHKELNNSLRPKMSSKRDYDAYLAQKILHDVRNWKSIDLIKVSYLNKLELVAFPNIYTLFNKFLDQTLKEDLLNLALLSRHSKEIDLACSNAITILAKSDFPFKNIDLSNIRVPKADLSQCLFINANFENSNLKEVKFLQSQFHNVNFKNCDLGNVKFGFITKISSQNGKGLSFSANDDYFYYRTDDNLMEIDLKTQESKVKARLSDFVSTHITKIHSTLFNPYTAKIHGQYIGLWAEYMHKFIFDINMTKMVFSSNWKYLAALTEKSIVLCWDTEKQVLGASKATTYRGAQLAFSPCNRFLVIIRTTLISLIKTDTWTLFRSIHGKFSAKSAFAFSHCGKKFAFSDISLIQLIDATTTEKTTIHRVGSCDKKVRGLSFSPCGRFLAFGSNENVGYVMDINSQNVTQIFTGFESNVLCALFSISNKYISFNDSKGNIKIYEFYPKFLQNDYNRHNQILNAKVSPKGAYLITTSVEKSVLWDLRTFNPKQIKNFEGNHYTLFVFSPFDTSLAIRKYPNLQIYDIEYQLWGKPKQMSYYCNYLSFSHCGKYLISVNETFLEYFRIPDMEMVKKVDIKQQGYRSLKFSDCGKYHYWTDSYYNIYIWDIEKEKFVKDVSINEQYSRYGFTPFLTQVALFDWRKQIRDCLMIWYPDSDKVSYLVSKGENINCCCFSHDEKWLVGGYERGNIKIWDTKTESVKEKFRSLLCRTIDTIEVVSSCIIIREKDNVEIFKSIKLG